MPRHNIVPRPNFNRQPNINPRPNINIDRVFHALGDPTRRAIVEKLSEGPISVSRLAAPLSICRFGNRAGWSTPKKRVG
jgi:hypothetical protein